MGTKVTDITKYSPKSSDVFLFDTNIWLFLFCPLGGTRKIQQQIYSSFLKGVKTSRSTIFINSLILSEFANAFLRLDFNLWVESKRPNKVTYKKDYVGTSRYKETVKLVTYSITEILKYCNKGTDNFNSLEINRILNHLQIIDFNDSYYIELSAFSKYKIVTDDHDFIKYNNHEQEILTILHR
jgi:hypothetical protein